MRKVYIPLAVLIAMALGAYVFDVGNIRDWFEPDQDKLMICSFNIQFLGQSTARDDTALAKILEDFDIVVVQELVAPPYEGTFPDGTNFRPDSEAAEFFNEMDSLGFDYFLSEEDTGTGNNIHYNSTATEWWVAFYRPGRVEIAG